MFETPDADPTWCAGTHEVEAEDAGPFDRPMPTAMAISGSTNTPYFQPASARPMTANPPAEITNPSATTFRPPSFAANRGTSGATRTSPTVAGRVARPACSAEKSECRWVLEVQAQHVHQRVDRACADEDRHGRPDEDAVAQQPKIQERDLDATLHRHEREACSHCHRQSGQCRERGPTPVAALTEGQDERPQRQRHEDRARVVDRPRAVLVARLGHGEPGDHHADHGDSGIDPEQPLPAGGSHQDATDQRTGRGANGGRRTPQ